MLQWNRKPTCFWCLDGQGSPACSYTFPCLAPCSACSAWVHCSSCCLPCCLSCCSSCYSCHSWGCSCSCWAWRDAALQSQVQVLSSQQSCWSSVHIKIGDVNDFNNRHELTPLVTPNHTHHQLYLHSDFLVSQDSVSHHKWRFKLNSSNQILVSWLLGREIWLHYCQNLLSSYISMIPSNLSVSIWQWWCN